MVSYTDNWLEDSKRRDISINAIYLDENGKIYDPQGGVEDLRKKQVKFIGDPNKRIPGLRHVVFKPESLIKL